MRIVYLVGPFPRISKTFIINPIVQLLDRGHDVEVIGRRPQKEEPHHEMIASYGLMHRTHYGLSVPESYVQRMLLLARHVAETVYQHPARAIGLTCFLGSRLWAVVGQGDRLRISSLFHRWPLLGFEYDVLHAHFGYNAIIAAELKAAELISGPLVTTFHGVDLNVYPNKHPKGVYQKVFSQSDALIVGSMFGRKRLLELGAPAERIKVMPTGIDLETFPFSERHRCQSKPVCVLTVSRLVEVKGIRYGIEAIARLQEQGVNVQYWIVGDGPLREELEALTRDLGVTESVIFFGAQTQEELKRIYTEAHLFLLPGIHAPDGAVETQGLVLAEAQATGLPVVASDCGGISESLREGHSGVLVPERDVERLASELARLVEQSSRWPEMGRYGRDFVTKKFDLQHHVDSLESLYEAL